MIKGCLFRGLILSAVILSSGPGNLLPAQEHTYEIDPVNKVFQSEQTYRIKHTGNKKTGKIQFAIHPQLEIKSIVLTDSTGKNIPGNETKLNTFEQFGGKCFPVFETGLADGIVPGETLDFTINYQLNAIENTIHPDFYDQF